MEGRNDKHRNLLYQMRNKIYRELNTLEKRILSKLLERSFPGRTEIREQIKKCRVRTLDEYKDNYESIEFKTDLSKKANVESRVPVQGLTSDKDGVPVEFFLHIVDGFINELEIVKADNSPLVEKIDPEKIKVTIYSEIIKE